MKKSTSTENTVSRIFKKFGLLTNTLEKEGVTFAHWQKPIDDIRARRNLAKYLKMGCPTVPNGTVTQPTLTEGEDLARLILGDDLITPEDIEANTGIRYTDEQKAHAAETIPTDLETLQAIKAGECMVIYPHHDMNLLEVRDLNNQLFYLKKDGWYSDDNEKFARTDKVRAGQWLIVRKTPVEGSTSKNWNEQSAMIKSGDRVPNAAEMSYAVTMYYKVRNVYLLKGIYVRTSSVDADRRRVCVGYFESDGLDVTDFWNDHRGSDLGVASARE